MTQIGGLSKLAPNEQDAENGRRTPPWLLAYIRECFGGDIELDPCTTRDNPTAAVHFIAPPDDGILLPWDYANIFVNPPYGKTIKHWVRKVLTAAADGRHVILLCPARTDTAWFQSALNAADDILLMRGRLYFLRADEEDADPAPFGSILLGYHVSLEPLYGLGTPCKLAQWA